MRARVLHRLGPVPAWKPLGRFTFGIARFGELQSWSERVVSHSCVNIRICML